MTRVLLLALFLIPSASSADEVSLKAANRSYEEGRFEASIEVYQELLKDNPNSATLHYNLGNAYFRLGLPGSLGKSVASYYRAFQINPRDGDIRHNYDFALKSVGETLISAGTPKALFVIFNLLSHNELVALQWIGLWISLLLCSVYLLRERLQERLRPWLVGTIAFWALCAVWLGIHHLTSVRRPGVVIRHNAEVRSGPGRNFPVSFKVPEGWRVSRLDAKGSWIEIGILKEGLKGWVDSKAVEKI